MQFKEAENKRVESEVLRGVEVDLPSRGVDYPWCKDGKILIRPKTVGEEEFVAEMTPENYEENLSRILERVILKPIGIDPWMLTQGDRSFLYLWLRVQVIAEYRISLTCPSCEKFLKNYSYSLENVPIVELKKEYDGPVDLTLPKSQDVVTLRLNTGDDERQIEKQVAENGVNMWRSTYVQPIVKINGVEKSFEQKYGWAEKLHPADFAFIRQFYVWAYHGPDFTDCPFTCPKCKEENRILIPFRKEYHLPSISFQASVRDAIHNWYVRKRGDSTGDGGIGENGGSEVSVAPQEGK